MSSFSISIGSAPHFSKNPNSKASEAFLARRLHRYLKALKCRQFPEVLVNLSTP
jgi:hypothetical protein